ncbi:hypothetical protein ACFLT1_09555, partial [Bacteroidota bacterium]
MKRIFTLVALILMLGSNLVTGQDTTDLRLIGIGGWGNGGDDDLLFFNADTSDFLSIKSNINSNGSMTGYALFVNPADNLLYGVADPDDDAGTSRKLYKVNPLKGQFDFVMDLGDWTVDAAITPEGRLFTIDGFGGANPGAIYEVDLVNQTQSQVAVSSVTDTMPRTMTYNPEDLSLYIYSAYAGVEVDSLYIMKVDTWNETSQACAVDGEIHGSYLFDNQILLSSSTGELVQIDLENGYDGVTQVISSYAVSDIEEIGLLKEKKDIGVCLNEPIDVVLHAKYTSSTYAWVKDGELIMQASADSLIVMEYGKYQLLTEIGSSGKYMRSEELEVWPMNVPEIAISATDSLWSIGDSITLSATPGGISQWYVNGAIIPGADSDVYVATAPGYYNMLKINKKGCSDSAALGIYITSDPFY